MIKKQFIEKLSNILSKLDFEEGIKKEAIDYIYNNYDEVSLKAKEAYEEDWDSYLRLMILIYKLVDLEKLYKLKYLPESVLLDTLSDLTLRQRLYFDNHNSLGLTEEDISWLKHIYYLNIFKLGSLQYEFGKMTYEECKENKDLSHIEEKVPKGSCILKVHIRRGVNLSQEAVDESFKLATKFFKTHYPNYNYLAYTCYSWMLYSKNHLLLDSSSNILAFSNRFELICETKRTDMSIKYIFGREYKDISNYPKETSLQRKALDNLENLGVGLGIIYK